MLLTLAALAALAAVFAIFAAGALAPKRKKPDNQKQIDLRESQRLLYESMRAERIHMLDSPRYKPAVYYVSPERKEPIPANVTKLRRKHGP